MNRRSIILLVDDNHIARETITALLAPDGHHIVEAGTGREALDLAWELRPDLVLLDVMMPGMDGYAVCASLRSDPRTVAVPIILITALDDRTSRVRGLEAGADDFLSKPIDSADLRARVRTVTRLNRYRLLFEEQRRADLLEEAQRHTAHELHDTVVQLATGLSQRLQTYARHHLPRSPEARRELFAVIDLAQSVVHESRRIIAGLRPPALDDLGLVVALRVQVEARQNQGWELDLQENLGAMRLEPAVELALFRIASEGLANIEKHANTQRASLVLMREQQSVRLELRDWGCGFNPAVLDSAASSGRFGLRAMRERIHLLGGSLLIKSAPNTGTLVVAEVPAPPEEASP